MMRAALVVALLSIASAAHAHEVRPGYLELVRGEDGTIALLWKAPMQGGVVFPIAPVLPEKCHDRAPPSREEVTATLVERRSLDCGDGLGGETIAIAGLERTLTNVIVRVDLPGMHATVMLKPDAPSLTIGAVAPWTRVARDYLWLGITHILFGVDHLLFVLGLVLIVASSWRLVQTVTAFTVAHSVTLALATLGVVHVPQRPVEAAIALSIVFLAVEIVHGLRGRKGLAHAAPWLVAFTFGLLHGFGFAGALAEVGLPAEDIPLALLFFNLGVEVGQLAFLAAIFAVHWLWTISQRFVRFDARRLEALPAYAIGAVASFWLIDRMATMLR